MSGIDIKLPAISERGSDHSTVNMIVAIDRAGNCFLENERLTLKDLYLRLKGSTERKKINVILQADRDVRHGYVVRVMDLAKRAGINSIIISAQWEPEKVF